MFKQILLLLSTVFLFLFLAPTKSEIQATGNLIPNASFEFGVLNPFGWQTNNSPRCTPNQNEPQLDFEWSAEIIQDGSRSLALKNIYWEDLYNPIVPGRWVTNDFIGIARSPQGYEISTWVYADKNNHSIEPYLTLCIYDINEKLLSQSGITLKQTPEVETWFELKSILAFSSIQQAKIKISLGAWCPIKAGQIPELPCIGSFWFDNVTVRPTNSMVAHTFNDMDKDGYPNWSEENLTQWEIALYLGNDCIDNHRKTSGWTNVNGNIIFTTNTYFPPTSYPPGNYSVQQTFKIIKTTPYTHVVDARDEGWVNTTPTCQNITLNEGETPTVHFGNVRDGPVFPYLSQLDPAWSQNEYDHAASIGPFFCGADIGGCGCAITSAAMLLKFHGATKSPSGENTNPDSLNTWLKNNNGYAFGALKWNSVAAYSVKANQNFGTQEIRFVGTSPANDFTTLDLDLSANKPQILQEPGHFIAAYAKQDPTYSIKDPAYENKKTLSSYSNSFQSARRFEKTNTDLSAIYISTPAPNELFLVDSQGRRVGRDPQNGEVFQEIPDSFYFLEPSFANQNQENPTTPQENAGVNTLVIINPEPGSFTINSNFGPVDFSAYDEDGEIKTLKQSSTSPETFDINYSPEPGSDFQVIQKIDIDAKPHNQNQGNGVFPIAIISDDNFNAQDVNFQTIKLLPNQIAPINSPLYISRGKDNLKDMLVFFLLGEYSTDLSQEVCLTGLALNGAAFRGCNDP